MTINQDSFIPFPTHQFLMQDQRWLRSTWENEVQAVERHHCDSSTEFNFDQVTSELEEDMPQLMDIASLVLRNPFEETNFSQVRELARIHGQQRSKSRNFTLHHLICEYQILRTVIFGTLEKANCLQATTLERVERLVDEGMMHATIVFAGLVQERLLTVQQDLTNNLIKADALKNRYETALLATGDVIWEWDLLDGGMKANDAIETTFKHPLSTVQPTASWWFDQIPVEDLDKVQRSLAAFFAGKELHWMMEYKFRRGDGTYADICSKAFIRRDPEGTPVSFMGAMQDISDRKLLERELKTHNEKLEAGIRDRTSFLNTVLDNLDDGIAACDISTQVTTTNRALLNIFGGPSAAFPGPTPLSIHHSLLYIEDGSRLIRTEETGLYRALQGEVVKNFKTRAILPDGTVRHLESDAQPLMTEDGRMLGAVVVVHDRTRDVIAAAEHESLCEQNRHLKNSEDQLRRTNVELENFAAVAAHDLKSPLNSISQFTEILSDDYRGRIGEEGDEILDFIQSASGRMRKLIDSLLSYAKSGAGLEIEFDVDADSICKAAVQNLSSTIRANQARVQCQKLPRLRGDPNRLLQVLQNLIGNGIKFGRVGIPVEVEIYASDEGPFWKIEVRDNGVGISPNDAASVFDFFKRLNTDQPREGTGIGLAVCKRIVESHGGQIWIEPAPHQGTSVFFTLPKTSIEAV